MPDEKAIKIKASNIRCDAEGCNYISGPVTVQAAIQYINKPCPRCGSNLLTATDYWLMRGFLLLVGIFNKIITVKTDKQIQKAEVSAKAKDGCLEIRGGKGIKSNVKNKN